MQRDVIAKRLRELRGERSQIEVAMAIGVTKGAISMYECGDRVPSDDIKVKLADYYGVTVQEIFYS